jgi:Tol biopolymer transport system component
MGTTPARIVILSAPDPSGYIAGTTIPTPVIVQVTDILGRPVPGTQLWFVGADGGLVTPNPAVTNQQGKVEVVWTLGNYHVGPVILEVSIPASPSVPTVTVTANAIPGAVAYVFVFPTGVTLYQGTSQQLASNVSDANFNRMPGARVAWTTSNPAAVGVSSSGVISALAPGEATITATSNGLAASAIVAVPVPSESGGPGIPPFTVALNVEHDKSITIIRTDGALGSRLSCGTQCSFLTGPVWSRDGSMLAVTGQRDSLAVLFVANRDGSNLHEVVSVPRLAFTVGGIAGQYWPTFQEDWSADGRLVYVVPKTSDTFGVEVVSADGTGRATLMTRTNPTPPAPNTPFLSYVNNPRWGLGDSMITVVIGGEIYGMNADGTNPHSLATLTTTSGAYTWSPNRQSIAFSASTSSQGTISILDPASGALRQIAVPAFRTLCWAPNSSAFSIVAWQSVQQNWTSIYTVQTDGSGLRKVVTAVMDIFNGVVGAWSPDGKFLVYTDDRRWSGGPVGPQLYAQSIDAGTNTKLSDVTTITWFTIAEVGGCVRAFVYPSP